MQTSRDINNSDQTCRCGFRRRARLQPSARLLDGGQGGQGGQGERRGALYEVLVPLLHLTHPSWAAD